MTPETRAHYEQADRWASARRRAFGDHDPGVRGPVHLGDAAAPAFVGDLLLLGWKSAVLLFEENTR